jgi:hypothetical protein
MQQTDVKCVHLDASGVAYAAPTRVRGFQLGPGGTAGEIHFYDNPTAASGTIKMTLHITINTAVIASTIPGEGVRFENGVYITLPANASISIFYG